jgi:hypothetical protein
MSQAREEFMKKWGIESEQELKDIIKILRTIMKLQFQRMRPKWSQQFGEEVLEAVEGMTPVWAGPSAAPTARELTAYQN